MYSSRETSQFKTDVQNNCKNIFNKESIKHWYLIFIKQLKLFLYNKTTGLDDKNYKIKGSKY